MKIFISWSGDRSRALALELRTWLHDVIHVLRPWESDEDIRAGARWGNEIAKQLNDTSFGIICLTKSNQKSPWLVFEAGALAKSLEQSHVVPYLIDFEPHEVERGPLSQFQAKPATKKGTLELLMTINEQLPTPDRLTDEQLRKSFEKWWPDLEKSIAELPEERETQTPPRATDEILTEILDTVRSVARQIQPSPTSSQANNPLVQISHGFSNRPELAATLDHITSAKIDNEILPIFSHSIWHTEQAFINELSSDTRLLEFLLRQTSDDAFRSARYIVGSLLGAPSKTRSDIARKLVQAAHAHEREIHQEGGSQGVLKEGNVENSQSAQ